MAQMMAQRAEAEKHKSEWNQDEDLIKEIRADWEEHKEEYLEFERKRACKIVNDLCDEGEIYRVEEDELTDEEMDAKLRELNL